MNQTIQELFDRKSVRIFTDEPITPEERKMILEAALQAPTAGNMALYSILDIQDQSLKEELAVRCDNQPSIAKAPLVLIFLADYQKWYDMFTAYAPKTPKLEEADLLLACEDCMAAAQNTVAAAWSMGIGSCYIGDILENFEENQTLLNLPKYAIPYAMIVFGKPTLQQQARPKPKRFPLEDMVHINRYHQKSPEETKAMFVQQTGKSEEELEGYITSFANRKFYADFRQEMNRSVKAILKHWTE